ncbi:hypothetical protein CLV37_13911 [Kineococcus rhizosphaerae]|uniref:Uncharacterized protein n=1 Tax=Kineococcus rhizosphaerae TaxID=559628 RepID=A0A2T0QLN7_9ACTN|nr:hypothetical protein CLV37_13911 [Kineococcus rhizosphaerae]
MSVEEHPSDEDRDRLRDRSRPAFVVLVRTPRAAFSHVRLTRGAADRNAAEHHLRGRSVRVVEVAVVAVDGTSLDPSVLPEPGEEVKVPKVSRHRRNWTRPAAPVDLSSFDRPVRELDGDEDLDGRGTS